MIIQPDKGLVSVVVPAFNAEKTIDRTLRSIRSQTHRNLEIVVVDDGSTDTTAELVRRHEVLDSRLRLAQTENHGVASARNLGVALTSAELIATIDADDIWASDKISGQVARMGRGGAAVGLVYTWHAAIDEDDRVISLGPRHTAEGAILPELARANLVGNGSAPLMRRQAIREASGYDASLRARGGQGCEDWKLYLTIAENWRCLPLADYMVGYRQTARSMTSDVLQMLRSVDLVLNDTLTRHPDLREPLQLSRREMMHYLLSVAVRRGRWLAALQLLWRLMWADPADAASVLALRLGRLVRGSAAAAPVAPPDFLNHLQTRFAPGVSGSVLAAPLKTL